MPTRLLFDLKNSNIVQYFYLKQFFYEFSNVIYRNDGKTKFSAVII